MAMSVLVADDSKFMHKVLGVMFKEIGGITSISAFDGAQALEAVVNDNPNVLILDLNMPGKDGIEILADLAMIGNVPALILMSGEEKRILRSVRDVAAAHGITVLGILSKPFKTEHVEQLLSCYVEGDTSIRKQSIKLSRDEIMAGLGKGCLMPVYQPLITLSDGQLYGVEALARWNDQHGLLPPSAFLPSMADAEIWQAFNEVLFKQVFSDLVSWSREGIDIKISLNIDLESLKTVGFADDFVALVKRYKISPEKITLEVTENNVMLDIREPLVALTRLRMKGFGISIDDFGTGASSIERIRNMPCNELKIDKSFVTNALNDPQLRTIVQSSIQIAKEYGLDVVAEGIEDDETLKMVQELGCDKAQGYSIGKPMTHGQLSDWILEHWQSHPDFNA